MTDTTHADLVLSNARVLTPDNWGGPGLSHAQAVAIRGDTITAVGRNSDILALAGPAARSIDCAGMTLIPGIVDSHCHLLALAASLRGMDCGPRSVSSIRNLQRVIQKEAGSILPGEWVRGFGYDDESLSDNRHPTRWDLDPATPDNPVRLDHRSGHATVLNSRGLELAGIHRDTPDPVDGVIWRDPATGEPTGLLLELSGFLRRRLGVTRNPGEFHRGIESLNRKLLSCGITSVQDAGPSNAIGRWHTFSRLQEEERLTCRITMMAGMAGPSGSNCSPLSEFQLAGLEWGSEAGRLRLGHAKIVLTFTTGTMSPDADALRELVAMAHQAGFPVAIHAVEREAIEAAAQVILTARTQGESHTSGRPTDRIEHCSECPPGLVDLVRRSGATVVTQPGLIYWQGDEYNRRVEPWLLPHLYPVGELARGGIPVAFGSDAPVTDPDPWPGIYAAATRATRSGGNVPPQLNGGHYNGPWPSQTVPVEEALSMYTLAGARSEGTQRTKGTIEAGKLADLVLLDKDPFRVETGELENVRPVLTIVGGRVVWET